MCSPGEPNASSDVTWYGPGSAFGAPSRGNERSIISRVMPGGCARQAPALARNAAATTTMVFCITRFLRNRDYLKFKPPTHPRDSQPLRTLVLHRHFFQRPIKLVPPLADRNSAAFGPGRRRSTDEPSAASPGSPAACNRRPDQCRRNFRSQTGNRRRSAADAGPAGCLRTHRSTAGLCLSRNCLPLSREFSFLGVAATGPPSGRRDLRKRQRALPETLNQRKAGASADRSTVGRLVYWRIWFCLAATLLSGYGRGIPPRSR